MASTKVPVRTATDPTQTRTHSTTKGLSTLPLPNKISSEIQLSVSGLEHQSLPSLLPIKRKLDYPSFSQLLEGVMVANSTVRAEFQPSSTHLFLGNVGFEGEFGMSHQEVLASVTAKAAQVRAQTQFQAGSDPSSEAPPVTQSELSVLSSSDVMQKELPLPQDKCVPDAHQKNSSHTTKPSNDIARTPNSDGFSWRKYGQKQVKNSESSRSYYRCTYAKCHAKKKVQHSDISGCIIGVVYRGDHNHDPPQKIKSSSLKRRASLAELVPPTDANSSSLQKLDSDAPACGRENEQALPWMPESEVKSSNTPTGTTTREAKGQDDEMANSTQSLETPQAISIPEETDRRVIDSNELRMIDAVKEHDGEPRQKKRMKEKGKLHSNSAQKALKEPKIVVHAAGDVGISSDGYRWRKYGQKMVKGNSHPRSYYRCTSAGCPVRKHVERATDNSTALIMTYEGRHDHDMPVPKKRHSPSNAALTAAAASANDAALHKTEASMSEGPSTQWSVDVKGKLRGEKVSELGTDKMLESARTLLSIGIELKSC
ncbi:hypothetical protein Ancab_023238 [Ancistrocladus abbreviatus]